jgi:site-specific DNA recombinase
MIRKLQEEKNGNGFRKQVGIWIRVSTEDQAKSESPEHHEKRARYYAESKGWDIKTVYHLEAVSGKSVFNHPETQRMLTDVRKGAITGLIFSKLARLARNTKELLDFSEIFRECNADLISLQESIDTSSPAGRLLYTMISALAQWERDEISDRVAASVPIRAKLGKPLGGAAPFGYQWKDRKLVPHPDEAPVRKRMYELFLEHRRKKVVARLLNESGYRTRNNSKFSDTTINRLLRDPTAKGLRRANYTKSLGSKRHWKFKPENEWIFTEVEPIVPSNLWQQCNHVLDEQEKTRKQPARKTVQLFAGLAVCACGGSMYVLSNYPNKYVCRKCRNKIPIPDLEDIYLNELKGFFMSPQEIEKYLHGAEDGIKEKVELLQILERDYQKLKQEMDDIFNLYRAKQITPEGFGKRYLPLEEKEKQLEDEVPKVQAEIDFLKINFLSSDEILSEGKGLFESWGQLEYEEKRKIVESMTESIIVGKDEVEVNLSYLPSTKKVAKEQQNHKGSWPQ